jgi:hypothetical protein
MARGVADRLLDDPVRVELPLRVEEARREDRRIEGDVHRDPCCRDPC